MNGAKILRKVKLAQAVLKAGETGVKDAITLLKEIEALGGIGLQQKNALSKLELAELKISQAFENIDYLIQTYGHQK